MHEGSMIRLLMLVMSASVIVLPAHAQRPTCILQAVEKKLAEPARTDFLKKCAAEVLDDCGKLADQRKLDGVDRNYFLKNCIPMYVGSR
jgi:hypothetical protein